VLLGVMTLFAVSLIVFAATQALPSDPARAILGRTATPESLAALRKQLNLNHSVVSQYTHWLGGVLTGDLGHSLAARGEPVTTVLGKRLENSAFLVLLAAVFSVPFSIFLGVTAARRRDGPLDHGLSLVLLALAALPEFVVGIALVLLFGTTVFHWLPAVSPYVARIMRASMVEVLESDFVEMARLKGMPERHVLWRHAVPNALAPAIQVIALNLAYLAGGIVVVEFVFGFPGIGSAFVDAVSNRDLPIVQALAVLIAAAYVCFNLLADVATILVSPRLRTSLR
jgi:peptide/nickel transport system permease protein